MAKKATKDMPGEAANAIFAARRKVADCTLAVSQTGKQLKQDRKELNDAIDAAYEVMFEMPLFDKPDAEADSEE